LQTAIKGTHYGDLWWSQFQAIPRDIHKLGGPGLLPKEFEKLIVELSLHIFRRLGHVVLLTMLKIDLHFVGIPNPTLAISDAAVWHGKATTYLLC
jgi:hypothetical protein